MAAHSEDCLERGETLAERLDRAPLPFSASVRYAYDVAKALRELHQCGKSHGSVNCQTIELRPSGAVLRLPSGDLPPADAWRQDLRGFGSVLLSLFPEEPPPPPPGSIPPKPAFPHSPPPILDANGVWSTARMLAHRCIAEPPDTAWTMQRAFSEFCVLNLVVRQWPRKAKTQASSSSLSLAPPTPSPPLPPGQTPAFQPTLAFASPVPCPRCGANTVHPSAPRTGFEGTLGRLHLPLLRCHQCRYRYFTILHINIPKGADNQLHLV